MHSPSRMSVQVRMVNAAPAVCHQCQSKQVSVLNKGLLCSPHPLLSSSDRGRVVAVLWAIWPLMLPCLARLQGQTTWEASSSPPTDSRGWKRKCDRACAVNSKIAISEEDVFRIIWSWQSRKKKSLLIFLAFWQCCGWSGWLQYIIVVLKFSCSPEAQRLLGVGLNHSSPLVPIGFQPSGLQISV